MNFLSKLSPLTQFKLAGSIQGFVSTIPGSIAFAIVFITTFLIKNENTNFTSGFYPFLAELGFLIVFGLVFSFFPAIIGGWYLASWIHKKSAIIKNNTGIILGAITGGLSMFGYDFLLGLLSLSSSHGPSLEMFLFYVITSTSIAILMGAWSGVQLIKKIPRSIIS